MSKNWRVRPFEPGDEAGICRLLERGFGHPMDPADWTWKLKQRPSPVENVWLAVDPEEQPIFHYGGLPRTLNFAGIQRDVMVAVDSTTHPGYRRQGLLTAGVKAAHQAWADAGVTCVLGLPNEQWGSRIQALDWRPLFPLTWWIRPLRPWRLLARRLGFSMREQQPNDGRTFIRPLWRSLSSRPDPDLNIREIEHADEQASTLSAACFSTGFLTLARNKQWLDWRYPDRYRKLAAFRDDQLAGLLAYRFDPESRYGFIAELLFRPDDFAVGQALAHAAADRLYRQGALAVTALAVPNSVLDRTLRRARFFSRRKSFHVHCVPLADNLDLESLRDPGRWWLQGGDFDII